MLSRLGRNYYGYHQIQFSISFARLIYNDLHVRTCAILMACVYLLLLFGFPFLYFL